MRRLGTMMGIAVAALTLAASAHAVPRDTTVRTIQDRDGDNLLEFAEGEDHCVFTLTIEPQDDCAEGQLTRRKPESVLNFLQLSDFQIVDEESPARVEALDTTQRAPGLNPFSAAHRPQESLTTQTTEAMVRQARNTTSPITGERLELAILTGDNADSQQHNETRWFIDILDGTTKTSEPNPDPEMDDRPGEDRKIVPDSGRHELAAEVCGSAYQDNGSIYDGVRNNGQPGQDAGYYEPDGEGDGDGYTPDRERNQAEVPGPHADVTVRDFPGLFEAAQEPFEAVGLGMPWYSAFGNHDALVQGNSGEAFIEPSPGQEEFLNPVYDEIARGCVKPTKLGPGISPEAFAEDPAGFLANPGVESLIVPPDERRCFLAKDEPNTALAPCATGGWIQQHSRTTGLPVGHGFEPFSVDGQTGAGRPADARRMHDGYYSFVPKPGLRFIVLDTVTDNCGAPFCAEGSIDHPQYQWLEREIVAAEGAGQYAMVFSHHTLRTTRMDSIDPAEQPVHFGEDQDQSSGPQPPSAPETTLEDLFCRHANVLAHVNGHNHENDIRAQRCEQSVGKNPFVEITTAAHIDWPQQARMIELVNEPNGDLALALTILDHDGPPNPGNGNASPQPVKLASIAREISYNDYQHDRGSRGSPSDRNVIVETGKKWPPSDDSP